MLMSLAVPTPSPTHGVAAGLAENAVWALQTEALLSPKPGLVDRLSVGAHPDMDLELLLTSAEALRSAFAELAELGLASAGQRAQWLRDEVGSVGRAGEAAMLQATGGVNTHRGALWSVGLLVTAAASGEQTEAQLCGRVAAIAALPDSAPPGSPRLSHGQRAARLYGATGARGQACAGLPAVRLATAALLANRRAGQPETHGRLIALLTLMATLQDTCLLHRGGSSGLLWFQQQAAASLAASALPGGGAQFQARLHAFDRDAAARGLSPGGSADLLSAALFLDRITGLSGSATT